MTKWHILTKQFFISQYEVSSKHLHYTVQNWSEYVSDLCCVCLVFPPLVSLYG